MLATEGGPRVGARCAVMTHPVPLRDQGTWAPRLIARPGCSIGYGIVLAVLAALAIPATLRATVRDDRIRR